MPAPLIFGCAGPSLGPEEKAFFRQADPLGFILFERNCENPEQVRALTTALRDTVSRDAAPILIDQEGGRVARLKPPHWREAPAGATFGDLYNQAPEAALEAARLNARLIAAELLDLGINVNCLPLLDLALPGAHEVIGDRAFGPDPDVVSKLGEATASGLMAGGILPVIKHMPGHGRATADSHLEMPRVSASLAELETFDFKPFAALSHLPLGMTAHVVYEALDSENPATVSARVISEVIRGHMSFDGLLLTDSLEMEALGGDMGERTRASLGAGCDIVLHCGGEMNEMAAVAEAAPPMTEDCARRVKAMDEAVQAPQPFDATQGVARLGDLLAGVGR